MTLTILGLFLNIIGALFLSYELVWGFQKRVWARYAYEKLEVLQRDMAMRKAYIDKIPKPPYSDKDLEDMKEDVDRIWRQSIEQQNRIIAEAEIKHPDRAIRFALAGVALLISGFAVQFGDAIMQENDSTDVVCETQQQSTGT